MIILLITSLCLISCKNQINNIDDEIIDVDFNLNNVIQQVATNYINRHIIMDNILSRNTIESEDYPEFMNNLNIVDTEGNTILFSDFRDEEKEIFFNIWKRETINQISKKISEDEDILKMVYIENELFDRSITKEECRATKINKDDFFYRYRKNLSKYIEKKTKERSVSKTGSLISKDNLSYNSARVLINNYRPGRILVTDGASLSSSEVGLGHASLFGLKNLNINNVNGNSLFSISSYPTFADPNWEGKINGVQYEPIGLWAGKKSPSIQKVIIYDMQKNTWVWDWFNSGYRKSDAPIQDYYEAARYAESMLGKSYVISPLKDSDSDFYCSKLVWKAWRQIDKNYDMSAGFFVTPSDIINSAQTKRVTDFKNY